MSINERLGALCEDRAGADFAPLTLDWLGDILAVAAAEAEDVPKIARDIRTFDDG